MQYNYDLLVKQEDNKYALKTHITITANSRSEAKKEAENRGYRVYSCVSKGNN